MDDNERAVQRVHQMCLVIENLGQELQDARCWAALWKQTAKINRKMFRFVDRELRGPYAAVLKAENQRKDAEIERLREALGKAADWIDGAIPTLEGEWSYVEDEGRDIAILARTALEATE